MLLPNEQILGDFGNSLLIEKMNYNIAELGQQYKAQSMLLNLDQKQAFNSIMKLVAINVGQFFFVNRHGGIGKTFLWKTIISKLCLESMIVLPIATSGIVTLLLPGGWTAYSRFHISITAKPNLTGEVKQGMPMAELLLKISLIIQDEAPMANKFCFKLLDTMLSDILHYRSIESLEKPFGGMTVVLGSDFRQIFLVVPKGHHSDIIDTSITSLHLWSYFEVLSLDINMRLLINNGSLQPIQKLAEFDKQLLNIIDKSFACTGRDDIVTLLVDMMVNASFDLR